MLILKGHAHLTRHCKTVLLGTVYVSPSHAIELYGETNQMH